jgi:hypothetical protein
LDTAILIESEMALFSECMPQCARKPLDTADIVREAIFRQQLKKTHFCGARKQIAFWLLGQLSEEALADSQKEILGIGTRLLHDPRIVAVFDFRLMKYKCHCNLRFVSSLYEHPSTLRESGVSIPFCYLRRSGKAGFGLALVLAKLHGG